jgi:hypothetical protein
MDPVATPSLCRRQPDRRVVNGQYFAYVDSAAWIRCSMTRGGRQSEQRGDSVQHVFLLAIAAACIACGSDAPSWCMVDDAEVVFDPRPTWSSGVSLERLWQIDGSVEGRELVMPAHFSIDRPAERLAVVDFDLGDVIVAGLDGTWIGRWGRRGQGPGEIGHALAARWTDVGNLEVYDPVGSKLIEFDTGGTFVGEKRLAAPFTAALGGGIAWISFARDGSLLARPVGLSPVSEGMMQVVVLRTDPTGLQTDTVAQTEVAAVEREGWMPFTAPNWPTPHAAVSSKGHVAVSGEQAEYRITVRRRDSTDLVICRPVDARTPSDEPEDQTQEIRAALRTARKPARPAAVGRVAYDEADRLWVQRDLPHTLRAEDAAIGREGAIFDVYADRDYLGEVQLPDRVRFLGATTDMILGLERGQLDELSLVAFRLVDRAH